jgi:hypothetical protein
MTENTLQEQAEQAAQAAQAAQADAVVIELREQIELLGRELAEAVLQAAKARAALQG